MGLKKTKATLTKFLLRLIGPFIFIYIIYFHVDINQVVRTFFVLRWDYFVLSVLLIPLSIYIRSVRWQRILKHHNIVASRWESFVMCVMGGVSASVVPTVGSFIKIPYIRNENKGLVESVISVLGEKYLDFILPIVFGILSCVLLYLKIINWLTLLIIFLFGFLLYALSRLFIKLLLKTAVDHWLKKQFEKQLNVKQNLLKIEALLDFYTYFLSVFEFAVGGFVRIFFLAKAIGIHMNFISIVLVSSVNAFITFIPISYLGIGTRDVGLIAAFRLVNHSSEEAVALSMAVLLSRIIFIFVGSVFWFFKPPPVENLKKDTPITP